MSQIGLLLEENKELLESIRTEVNGAKSCLEEKMDALSSQLQVKGGEAVQDRKTGGENEAYSGSRLQGEPGRVQQCFVFAENNIAE